MMSMDRREFLELTAAGAVSFFAGCSSESRYGSGEGGKARPNILWISTEDLSPDLGCYGDEYAVTPNLDAFARRSVRYDNAFGHAGVCAPVRSGIITGMYASTIGTCPMRCEGVPQPYVKCFTEYLRAAGYYCTNNQKTDYQFESPLTAWDDCSGGAHWRNRGEGKPFFSVFNITVTHESKIRDFSEQFRKRLESLGEDRHDPADAPLAPYYPDVAEVRRDIGQYYDIMTLGDRQFGAILDELEADGLAEDTIVFFWGDHGRGLPRAKRWLYDSGIRFPLLVYVPEKYRHLVDGFAQGSSNDELVGFIDLGPTVLSLASVPVAEHMQGRAFLGSGKGKAREYVFGARDRIDAVYDLIRAVRDKRFKYIRNFMAHLPYAQRIRYMDEMPTMQVLRRLNELGELNDEQKLFFRERKPLEELYDTKNDPHELKNLAGEDEYREVLLRMRGVLREWMIETGDVGLIPEPEFEKLKHPAGRVETTKRPRFHLEGGGLFSGSKRVRISCATAGASIAWRIEGVHERGQWQLYSEPIELEAGQELVAKAVRIGFRDSAFVKTMLEDIGNARANTDNGRQHFSQVLAESDMLSQLLDLKDLDFKGAAACPEYLSALDDNCASVRYWAVMGICYNCEDGQLRASVEGLREMLNDGSAVVRIAAAEALCKAGLCGEGLNLLGRELDSEQRKVRLWAMTAVKNVGDEAGPLEERVRESLRDPYPYVARLAETVLEGLRG